jgi:hypothetical protein
MNGQTRLPNLSRNIESILLADRANDEPHKVQAILLTARFRAYQGKMM